MRRKKQDQPTATELVKWIRRLASNDRIIEFYKSGYWKSARAEALAAQNNECQRCKAKGLYTTADTVHHKIPLRKNPALALTQSNLEALCKECHYEEHHKSGGADITDERW